MKAIGLGTMVMMPVIGNLSDRYGIKAVLTLPMCLSILPPGLISLSLVLILTLFFFRVCFNPSLDTWTHQRNDTKELANLFWINNTRIQNMICGLYRRVTRGWKLALPHCNNKSMSRVSFHNFINRQHKYREIKKKKKKIFYSFHLNWLKIFLIYTFTFFK